MSNTTQHSFNWNGCAWRVEIDQDFQEIVWAECNGERFDCDEAAEIIVRLGKGDFKIVDFSNALYDAALEIDPEGVTA